MNNDREALITCLPSIEYNIRSWKKWQRKHSGFSKRKDTEVLAEIRRLRQLADFITNLKENQNV